MPSFRAHSYQPCVKKEAVRKMLNMSQIEKIRDLDRKGYRPSEIRERTGMSYPTIRKYLAVDDFSPRPPVTRTKESMLDEFKGRIDEMMAEDRLAYHKQHHTARRVFVRLREENGYTGSYSTVRRYVREARAASGNRGKGPFLDLVWPAGAMQVDFGQADFDYECTRRRMHYLVSSFPQSNHALVQVFGDEKAVCVCQGIKDVFEHIGGVAPMCVFDNATEVGRRICEEVRESAPFRAFRLHYDFEVVFTNPDSGHEKGNVEGKVGWIRRNLFVPVPAIGSLVTYNADLLGTCDACSGTETHYERGKTWAQLFEADRMALLPLPRVPFDVVEWRGVKADGYGKVTIDRRHRYLAHPELAGRQLIVGIRAYEVEISRTDGAPCRTYRRRFGSDITDDEDPLALLETLSHKTRAFANSSVHAMFDEATQAYLDAMERQELRGKIQTMCRLVRVHDMDTVVAAFEDTLSRTGTTSETDVEMTAARIERVGRGISEERGSKLIDYDTFLERRSANG